MLDFIKSVVSLDGCKGWWQSLGPMVCSGVTVLTQNNVFSRSLQVASDWVGRLFHRRGALAVLSRVRRTISLWEDADRSRRRGSSQTADCSSSSSSYCCFTSSNLMLLHFGLRQENIVEIFTDVLPVKGYRHTWIGFLFNRKNKRRVGVSEC